MKVVSLFAALFLAGCAADGTISESGLPAPSRHDAVERPAAVKTAQLQYGTGNDLGRPDHFAPVITAPGLYPTEHQALHAFQRADHKFFGAYNLRLFACAPGAFNGATGRVDLYPGKPVVHCASVFFDRSGRQLGQIPVNYYYHERKWQLRDAEGIFAAPFWALVEPTLPQFRWSAVK